MTDTTPSLPSKQGATMTTPIDRVDAEAVLYRVAVTAFAEDAASGLLERDTLHAEVAWCLEPLQDLPEAELEWLRAVVAAAILNPTAHRHRLRAAFSRTLHDDAD